MAIGDVSFRQPSGAVEELLSVSLNFNNLQESRSISTVRSVPITETRLLGLYIYAFAAPDPYFHSQMNGFKMQVDPAISIDPTATVEIDGVLYPATDVFGLQMSGGMSPVQGNYHIWNNPQGGSFETADNWRGWEGPGVPPPSADLEFSGFFDPQPYTVGLAADHVARDLNVLGGKVTLDLGGYGLLSEGRVEVAPDTYGGIPLADLEIRNGTLQSNGPLNLVQYSSTQTKLRIGPEAVVSCPTLELRPNIPGANPSIATLIMDGGELTTGRIGPQGNYLNVQFNSGHLKVRNADLMLGLDQPYSLGDGTAPATLTFEGDRLFFFGGLHIRSQGSLVFSGQSLYMKSLAIDDGGSLEWNGGNLGCGGPLEIGPVAAVGPTVILNQKIRLLARQLTIKDGGAVLVRGGELNLQGSSCEKRPGGLWEYSSGRIDIQNLDVGPNGLSGPSGDTSVSLGNAQDIIKVGADYDDLAAVHLSEGYRLAVSAGEFRTSQLVVGGVFDYGGPAPEEPGRGILTVYRDDLRIGGGSGDAVLNGRSTVVVAPEGRIDVTWGVLSIDPGYTLRLQGSADWPLQVQAGMGGINVRGDLVLEGGGVFSAVGGVNVEPGGRLLGNGTIMAPLHNAGTISPGASPGVLYVQNNFVQDPSSKLVMEIASSTAFDQLIVSNQAQLAGTLEIILRDGYTPGPTDSFELISAWELTGRFEDVVVSGGDLRVAYSSTGFVVSAVPEPSGVLLATVGGLCLIGYWARRRNGTRR